jgi:hypothetical protein
VVDAVQQQYALALNILGTNDFPLTEADLSLKVITKGTASGDITVLIFKPSAKYIRTSTSTVTFTLAKAAPPGGGGKSIKDTSMALRDAIVSAVRAFKNLKIDSALALKKDHFVIDLDFSIEYDEALGLTFKVFGLAADLSAERDHTIDHELKLTFSKPPDPKADSAKSAQNSDGFKPRN